VQIKLSVPGSEGAVRKTKKEITGRIYGACKLLFVCKEVNASYKYKCCAM
jgi:hypothetical protein